MPPLSNSFFNKEGEKVPEEEDYANEDSEQEHANVDQLPVSLQRTKDTREILIIHLNVNSLQNKVEEIGSLIKESKAQVVYFMGPGRCTWVDMSHIKANKDYK